MILAVATEMAHHRIEGMSDGRTSLGLRERHKRDKRERISNAAIRLFAKNGYEATTLREIAYEADVALGTLALYARDKRDLVLMIFNKLVPELIENGQRQTDPSANLTNNILGFFGPFYEAYANDVTLYRIILGQIYNGDLGIHGTKNDVIRSDLIGYLADLVAQAIAANHCRADADASLSARCFFYLYFAAVRTWLFQADPSPIVGLATLRALVEEYVRGLTPLPA